MSEEIKGILMEGCGLGRDEANILLKNVRQLSKNERRILFRHIKPREREFKLFLKEKFQSGDSREREKWVNATVESMLARKGDPNLLDSMVMDVVGRLELYKIMRERAEKHGVRLSAMANFGGLSMVLYIVVIVTAVILYFYYR